MDALRCSLSYHLFLDYFQYPALAATWNYDGAVDIRAGAHSDYGNEVCSRELGLVTTEKVAEHYSRLDNAPVPTTLTTRFRNSNLCLNLVFGTSLAKRNRRR